jgi:mono/diheme cytochrome c family protein
MKTSLIAVGAMGFLMAAQVFAADAAKGKEGFENNCGVCHDAATTERKMGPGLKGLFKRDKLANGKAVNEANVTGMINEGGNGMPPFADVLTKTEKDDIVAYLKSL